MNSGRLDLFELARSVLIDMAPTERAAFLTEEIIKINDLGLACRARNQLTDHISDVLAAQDHWSVE